MVHNGIWLLGSALKPARNAHFLHAIFKKAAIFSSYRINFSYTERAITNGLEFDYISMSSALQSTFKGINRKQGKLQSPLKIESHVSLVLSAKKDIRIESRIFNKPARTEIESSKSWLTAKKIPGKTKIRLKRTRTPPVSADLQCKTGGEKKLLSCHCHHIITV